MQTKVPIVKSKAEILALFEKRGAKDYFMGRANSRDFICCVYQSMPIKIELPQFDVSKEKEGRRAWRVMLLLVKAQFEAIDSKIISARGAFLPYLQLTDGRSVSQAADEEGTGVMLHMSLPAPANVGK